MKQQGFDFDEDENGCGLIIAMIILLIGLLYLITK
jgi:hypothetical protein